MTRELLEQAMRETREGGQASCVTTRDGRAVRIYALDGSASYPVHGSFWGGSGWLVEMWKATGRAVERERPFGNDLIPANTGRRA